jgi:hypothetical protein
MSKQLTIAQAQQQLPNLPKQLTHEPIIITGKFTQSQLQTAFIWG